jgi:hypothetical protein
MTVYMTDRITGKRWEIEMPAEAKDIRVEDDGRICWTEGGRPCLAYAFGDVLQVWDAGSCEQ